MKPLPNVPSHAIDSLRAAQGLWRDARGPDKQNAEEHLVAEMRVYRKYLMRAVAEQRETP